MVEQLRQQRALLHGLSGQRDEVLDSDTLASLHCGDNQHFVDFSFVQFCLVLLNIYIFF